jgi:hypothetical protein
MTFWRNLLYPSAKESKLGKDLAKNKQQTEQSTFGEPSKGHQREPVDAERKESGGDL